MSKITKRQLHNGWHCHDTEIVKIKKELRELKQSVLRLEKLTDEKLLDKPQLKRLDQSVFDGLDEKWRFATVSSVGIPFVYDYKPTGKRHFLSDSAAQLMVNLGKVMRIDEYDYDTTDWQNSLIEREKKELTGSDLARAMLERGDKYIVCTVDYGVVVITGSNKDGSFFSTDCAYTSATPINNQGEPLTAAEAGL